MNKSAFHSDTDKQGSTGCGSWEGQSSDRRLLNELLCQQLKDIYWAEKHVLRTLPYRLSVTTSPNLKLIFEQQLAQTRIHVTRLETALQLMHTQPIATKSNAIVCITEEGDDIVASTPAGSATRDAGLILAMQKVGHYEIATYTGLTGLAYALDHVAVAELLEATLNEEKTTDALITESAVVTLNRLAALES